MGSLVASTTATHQDPTAPFWILRHHSPCPITALAFVGSSARVYRDDDEDSDSDSGAEEDSEHKRSFLLAGDGLGRVSLTDITTYRPILQWQAHKSGSSILGVEIWGEQIVTHGRDNTIKVWELPALNARKASFASKDGEEGTATQPTEALVHEVNALNFCRFSLLPTSQGEALLAVPHTLESGWIDIYHLPSKERLHTAVGKGNATRSHSGPGIQRAAILMSVHLFTLPKTDQLALFAGYEDGTVQLWVVDEKSAEFALKWTHKAHLESVLSTALHLDTSSIRLVSTGADTHVALATCSLRDSDGDGEKIQLDSTTTLYIKTRTLETDKPGRACSSFLSPPKPFVVGGWDGKARVYDASTMTCTRVLRYHKESIQAVSSCDQGVIALGSKDGRVSLWRGDATG